MSAQHIVLARDSIFDNGGYVPGEPSVTEQLQSIVPKDWRASRVAVDGDCLRHIRSRISKIPNDTTYLVISIGGNDVLGYADLLKLMLKGKRLEEILEIPLREFRQEYSEMLDWVKQFKIPFCVCTIYTSVPFKDELSRSFAPTAINFFNDVIRKTANERNIPVIRLDKICSDPTDYSAMSTIEPSSIGGQKIAQAIHQHVKATSMN